MNATKLPIKTLISFLIVFQLQSFVLANVKQSEGGSVTGRLTAPGPCKRAPNQVWVSKERTLLYQAEVPENGTYEFHLIPGKYILVGNNPKGCFVEKTFEIKKNQNTNVNLTLVKLK